jgi:hypothetical protein
MALRLLLPNAAAQGAARRIRPAKEGAMGIFANILEKLGLSHHPVSSDAVHHTPIPPPTATPASRTTPTQAPSASPAATPTAAAPKAISEVDVVAQLERRAAANPQKLNWRTSIVDLLKLLDIDSSLEARKSLAKELGASESEMSDSAHMNMWLHREVLKRIAANGGNVPANLLD